MYCPNCGAKLKQTFCAHCGYMKNGNFIETQKEKDENLLSYYFGNRYDYYIRNKNWVTAGVLGPIYIFCHNFYIAGLLLFLFDISILLSIFIINHTFLLTYIVRMVNILFFIVNRFVWATIGNMIYLKLLSGRLERIKENNPFCYKELLSDYHFIDQSYMKAKYIIYSVIGISMFFLIREIIYSSLYIS